MRISDWSSDVCSSDLGLWPYPGYVGRSGRSSFRHPDEALALRLEASQAGEREVHGVHAAVVGGGALGKTGPKNGARCTSRWNDLGSEWTFPQAPAAHGRAQWLASRPSPCRLPRFLRRRRIGMHSALAPTLGRIRMSYRLAGLATALLLTFSTHAQTPAAAPAPAPTTTVLKAAHLFDGRSGALVSPGLVVVQGRDRKSTRLNSSH